MRPSAEEMDREIRFQLVDIAKKKNKSAYHRQLAELAECFIDYIDVKHRVLPRNPIIKIPKVP